LRDKAELDEEVVILGLTDHLEIWNKEKLDKILEEKPLTNEDFESIAELLPQGKTK